MNRQILRVDRQVPRVDKSVLRVGTEAVTLDEHLF